MSDYILRVSFSRRALFGILFLLASMVVLCMPAIAADSQAPFESLGKRLIKDGFDSARITAIFSNPAVTFEKKGVSAYFMHNEASLNYKQFTRVQPIASAKKYMQAHRQAFSLAEKNYGVDKEVITAIILVETKLGKYVGNKSVINTLATLSAMRDNEVRQIIWDNLPNDSRRISRKKFEKKADRKSRWAYEELKAFLTYTEKEGMDPTTIKGSYAGALGISQFMPSNAIRHGRDGDKDGRVDLFVDADAISSIANYLKHYGWGPGISREKAYKAVYHYNHSKYYVKTVLDIADKLKG
jgi:membrane-bound lytic murein transglycosylase B